MLLAGFEGPKEQWRAELESVNKLGLLVFADSLMMHLDAITGGMNRDSLLKSVRFSKKCGKWDAATKLYAQFKADPDKVIDEAIRRSRAAKKAARRRKKAR
jgi:hypothetical protein